MKHVIINMRRHWAVPVIACIMILFISLTISEAFAAPTLLTTRSITGIGAGCVGNIGTLDVFQEDDLTITVVATITTPACLPDGHEFTADLRLSLSEGTIDTGSDIVSGSSATVTGLVPTSPSDFYDIEFDIAPPGESAGDIHTAGGTGPFFTITNVPQLAVGGTFLPIDTTSLLLAGAQSISMWMIPVILAGVVVGVFVIKRGR